MNPDDPRLTAYALGELSEEEAIEFERMLAEDESLQEAINEIRETAETVRTTLGADFASVLTAEEEELIIANAIESDEEPEPKIVRVPFYRNPAYMSLAAAIVMLLSLLGALTIFNDIRKAEDEALPNKQKSVYVVDTPAKMSKDLTKPPPPSPVAVEVADFRDVSQAESLTVTADSGVSGSSAAVGDGQSAIEGNFIACGPGDAPRQNVDEMEVRIDHQNGASLEMAGNIASQQNQTDGQGLIASKVENEEAYPMESVVGSINDTIIYPKMDLDGSAHSSTGAVKAEVLPAEGGKGVELEIEDLQAKKGIESEAGAVAKIARSEKKAGPSNSNQRAVKKEDLPSSDSDEIGGYEELEEFSRGSRNPLKLRRTAGRIREVFQSKAKSVAVSDTYIPPSITEPILHQIPLPGPISYDEFNTEAYDSIEDNPFLLVEHSPLSTFSIDVDTASYANIRRYLSARQRPPKDAVRIEELVNYFPYEYALPDKNEHPLKIDVESASAPWQEEHRLVRVALKGKEIDWEERPASNVVFLLDVSGSMQSQNKLPLVKESVELLARKFDNRDRVAIVTYAGQSRIALPSTTADNTETILHAVRNLNAGGSTHASAGIEDAYRIAEKHLVEGGNNRVILCTDGDFNVGVTNRGELVDMIEKKAKKGIFLTILGFGMGNYKDATLEELSNKGNGNYGYIDTRREARKVFVEQVAGTMVTIAKDVKLQVEFNSAKVQAYRLIGYENRRLAAQDFNDDKKDAGEIGAGHTVTAFYEVIPAGLDWEAPGVDPLKYQKPAEKPSVTSSEEMLTVKLRYKLPQAETSTYLDLPFIDRGNAFVEASVDFRFAAGVAAFGMVLRDSPHKGSSGFDLVRKIAENAQGNNRGGYRSEFLHLIALAEIVLP